VGLGESVVEEAATRHHHVGRALGGLRDDAQELDLEGIARLGALDANRPGGRTLERPRLELGSVAQPLEGVPGLD
jgi:hypothetical protein